MGAKGLVLNHSTIAWKQISLCFRGIAEDALSLSTVVGSWPALGQASLFPQPGCDHKMFSHEEWHSQLASGELSSSSTPRTTSHYCSAVAGACSPETQLGSKHPAGEKTQHQAQLERAGWRPETGFAGKQPLLTCPTPPAQSMPGALPLAGGLSTRATSCPHLPPCPAHAVQHHAALTPTCSWPQGTNKPGTELCQGC